MSKLRKAGRLCIDCRQVLPSKAKVCPSCKAFQDWRRYIAIGQTNLALLVALISVVTTFVTIGIPFSKSPEAELHTIFFGSGDLSASFMVKNAGRASGVF